MNHWLAAACAAAVAVCPHIATAADLPLTFDAALARARERAPAILAARAGVDETRARLVGASVLLRDNPEVDGAAGARLVNDGTLLEGNIGVRQVFELGGRRRARIDAATAAVTRTTATSADVTRHVLRDAGSAFFIALDAAERQRLAERTTVLAEETLHIAQRRHTAGDIGVLDVNVATAALARSRSEVQAQAAAAEAAHGDLRMAIGMGADEPMNIVGDLRDRRRFTLPELLARAPDRPDLQALAAEAQESQADLRLGHALRWPNVGIGATYERDDGQNVALGTISLTLPVFERGQGLRAEAGARERRAQLTLETNRRTVTVEVQTAFAVYRRREAAVAELEQRAVGELDATEVLARRSYEVGQISLAEFLGLQREVLATRTEYLNRLLEAALAGVGLAASAGVLQ